MKRLTLIAICTMLLASCTSQIPQPISGLIVDFTYSISDKTVTFTNNSSPELKVYQWLFGDDTYLFSKETVTHPYAKNGMYEVTLTCKDANGYPHDCTKIICIGGSQGEGVSAYFEYEMFDNFHSLNIKDMSNGVRAIYDFGDGSATEEITLPYEYLLFHNYTKNGTYTIKCTAYGSNGASTTYSEQVIIRDPKIYITGIEYLKVDYSGEFYKAVLKDDDIFTTTWFTTYYICPEEFPYTYRFSSPVEMNGLDEDDYYTLYIYHNKYYTGDGTQCLKQNIYTQVFKACLPYIEVKNNSGNTVVHLLMDYK